MMPKLISLNIETNKHYERVIPFLTTEAADIVCLQEAPEEMLGMLANLGYHTSFLPMFKIDRDGRVHDIGVLLAARTPFAPRVNYYHQPTPDTVLYDEAAKAETRSLGYLIADIELAEGTFTIATTHFWDSGNGHEDPMQTRLLEEMLGALALEPAHVLCGDFNIPRGHNQLYPTLTKIYSDNIPSHYQSSLDKNLHRAGQMVLDEPIFEWYMVDYLFTKSPYGATAVRLQFGVSDHAAIVATLTTH